MIVDSWGSGFKVLSLRVRDYDLGSRSKGLGFRIQGSGFNIIEFRVYRA